MKEFKLDNEAKITSGFITPDGYFDTLSDKILAQLPKQDSKVISLFSYRKTWLYALAAILILMLSIPLFTKYSNNTEEIDNTTLENYLAYQATISEEEILNLLEQEDLDKMKIEFKIQDKELEDAIHSNINLEHYLTN